MGETCTNGTVFVSVNANVIFQTAIVLFAIIITSLVWWIGFNGGDHWDTMMEKINNNTVSVAA